MVIGLGYIVAAMTSAAIHLNTPRPLRHSAVSGPSSLLTSLSARLILVVVP